LIVYSVIDSPIGPIVVAATERGLCRVLFSTAPNGDKRRLIGGDQNVKLDRQAVAPYVKQIKGYFEGKRREFDLPLDVEGTSFQKRAWEAIGRIPYGETRSYGEVAREAGYPRAARAVGGAANANPVPLVIPCHRLIGADGSLVGYAPGLEIKRWLLDFEKRLAAKSVRSRLER
jgi:O-6-methylguanine DNA methyltransferase